MTLRSTFYIFGGVAGPSSDSPTRTIAAFSTKTKEWKKKGDLNQARWGHKVLVQKDVFITVGGVSPYGTEKPFGTERCEMQKDDTIRCTVVAPLLTNCMFYAGLIPVLDDYCSE